MWRRQEFNLGKQEVDWGKELEGIWDYKTETRMWGGRKVAKEAEVETESWTELYLRFRRGKTRTGWAEILSLAAGKRNVVYPRVDLGF